MFVQILVDWRPQILFQDPQIVQIHISNPFQDPQIIQIHISDPFQDPQIIQIHISDPFQDPFIHSWIRKETSIFEGQPAWVRSRSVWSVGEKSQSLSFFARCFWIQNTLAVLSVNNTSGWWFRPFLEKYLKPPPRILLQKNLKPYRYYLTVCNPVWSQPKTIGLYLIRSNKNLRFFSWNCHESLCCRPIWSNFIVSRQVKQL